MKKIQKLLFAAISGVLLFSCSTPKNISYFQGVESGKAEVIAEQLKITVRPEDKISIVVNSKDPLLADMFNLPIVSHRVGYSSASNNGLLSSNQQISCYTVDNKGEIDFPVLGPVKVAGLERSQIANLIKSQLIEHKYVNDPVVTVEFANLYISVLGEVNKPGRYNIDQDRVSLLDAIGMAGDLTIMGKRTNVTVLRQEGNSQRAYRVDLTSVKDLYQSPAFYLQQKDVVYVEPNDTKIRQSTVNGNNVRSTSFWISLTSLLTSIAVLICNLLK